MRPTVGFGKWIGRISVLVSATLPRKLRRDFAACSLSVSKMVDQLVSRALQRVVHHVACHHRVLAAPNGYRRSSDAANGRAWGSARSCESS